MACGAEPIPPSALTQKTDALISGAMSTIAYEFAASICGASITS